jgi:large subunit ribosomal protein L15
MSVKLHTLPKTKGAQQKTKRRGRGHATGQGKTSGRGHKGGKARSGYSINPFFEGGQMPLYRKLPHRGFNNARFRADISIVNVSDLNDLDAKTVTAVVLHQAGLIRKPDAIVKILGNGDLKKALEVSAHQFSESAKKKIEAAGGKVHIIE